MKVAAVLAALAISLVSLQLSSAKPVGKHKYMHWLAAAGYYEGSQDDVDEMSEGEVEKAMGPSLKKMKQFFGLGNNDVLDSKTMKAMEEPRCGNKDIEDGASESSPNRFRRRKRAITFLGPKENKWKDMPVTVGFKSYSDKMSEADQDKVAMECARKWAAVSGLSFRLEKSSVPNIHIEYVPLDVVGVASSPAPFLNPPSTYMRLNSQRSWIPFKSSGGQGLSLEEAVCHEMGHNLGLGHSDQRSSIMFPTVGFRTVNTVLGPDDKSGITELYGGPNGEGPQPPTGTTQTPLGPPTGGPTQPTRQPPQPPTGQPPQPPTGQPPQPPTGQPPQPSTWQPPQPTWQPPQPPTGQPPQPTWQPPQPTGRPPWQPRQPSTRFPPHPHGPHGGNRQNRGNPWHRIRGSNDSNRFNRNGRFNRGNSGDTITANPWDRTGRSNGSNRFNRNWRSNRGSSRGNING